MKVLILLTLAAVAYARSFDPIIGETTAHGFIQKYAIPLGEEIRKAEERMIQQRIIGGSLASLGQFPYQAGLLASYVGVSGTGVCGGSLVNQNRVITAAHCWYDGQNQASRFTVVLGSVTLFFGGTRIDSTTVAVHPNWSPLLVRNDVAVIYLPTNVVFSDIISPIALPSGDEINRDYTGASVVASGFGLTANGGSITTNQALSHVNLNVITNNACFLAFPFNFANSNICTGGDGVSPCRGDSGGALTTSVTGRNIMIGIVSFGSPRGCGVGYPAVYARVTSFLDFFNQHLA